MCDEGLLNVVLPVSQTKPPKNKKQKNPKLLVKQLDKKRNVITIKMSTFHTTRRVADGRIHHRATLPRWQQNDGWWWWSSPSSSPSSSVTGMIVRPLVVAVALACIVALVAKTALHYALSFGDKRGRRRLKKGRTTRLFGREQREEELDEYEPGYAAFLKSDGYEENFSRG